MSALHPIPRPQPSVFRRKALRRLPSSLATLLLLLATWGCSAPHGPTQTTEPPAWEPDSCTSIMVGRLASTSGAVITSHTCDGNYRTWIRKVPAQDHTEGAMAKVYKGRMHTETPEDTRGLEVLGEIPQVRHTFAWLDTAYPCQNEHQLSMGETTFGGRKELRSDRGIFYVEELQRFALERTTNARDAIKLMGLLAEQYGYVDGGECLTVADPHEVWQFEVMGPGAGRTGAVWAAARIPDDHVGISANICRISRLDLSDPDRFLASPNVESLATEMGWWDPRGDEPFVFWKAYSGRKPFKAREFFVLSTLAPSLGLDFDADEELPLSVKPERKLSVRDVMAMFRQTYPGHRFELAQNLVVKDAETGEPERSPWAHPWHDRGERALFNALREGTITYHRPIPVMYNAYSVVLECRSWLPDAVGGRCWFGYDNPAITPRAPLHAGITGVPNSFNICDQHRFRRDSAAWAFRRAARLASIKWGDHERTATKRILVHEERAFTELAALEEEAVELHASDPDAAAEMLTRYDRQFCEAITADYWRYGDELWMAYRFRM